MKKTEEIKEILAAAAVSKSRRTRQHEAERREHRCACSRRAYHASSATVAPAFQSFQKL